MKLNEALFSLVQVVRSNVHQKVKSLDIDLAPMHLKSLKVISRIDECTGQKLSEYMGRDKAQINRLIKELTKQGLVNKSENELDKRSYFLTLSTQGEFVMNKFSKAEKEVFERMLSDIPPQEIDNFIALIQQLKTNLNN